MNQGRGDSYKIRVLHVVQTLGIGGAEILLLQYIKALGMENYDHYVYCFGHDGPLRQRLEALGVPVRMGQKRASIKQPIRFGLSLLVLTRDLLSFIRSSRIQVIQSHLGKANQLGVAVGKLSGVPAIPTIHSTMPFIDGRRSWDPRVYLIKAVDWVIYRVADCILAVSPEVKTIILQTCGLQNSKVLALKNGIVLEDSLTESVDLDKEFRRSANTLKVIAVGRLFYTKAFDVLVRASELVKQELDDLLLLIAGEGEDRMRLEKLIRHLGVGSYVKLLGLRHDVMGLMKASDIFVMPSHYEGLSIAMIEAMACGLPIVASDAPGLRDYVDHEQNGFLFPVGDHKALAECILRLANDKKLRVRLSRRARECFEREYDMRRNVKPLDILFRRYASTR